MLINLINSILMSFWITSPRRKSNGRGILMVKFFKKLAMVVIGVSLTPFFFGVALWEGTKTVAKVMWKYYLITKEAFEEV